MHGALAGALFSLATLLGVAGGVVGSGDGEGQVTTYVPIATPFQREGRGQLELSIPTKGEVALPGLVQYLPGKKARYYAESVGGYGRKADVGRAYVLRANGLVMGATKRLWFDPAVPPGSTIVVPERGPGRPFWRNPRLLGFVGGMVVTSAGWYAAQ